MAYKINKDKAALIAAEYMTNGNDDVKALLSVGYAKNYVYNNHHKIMENGDIQEAINKIKAMSAVKKGFTIDYIQSEHERLAKLAEEKGDYSTATRNKELLGKTIAAYSDNINNYNTDKPLEIQDDDRQELMQAAIKLTKTG